MPKTCIIIGASHAAAQLAPSLRQEGWDGDIMIIGDEPHIPYHRPPLSKAFLAGEKDVDGLLIRPQAIYEKNAIEFKLGVRAEAINRGDKTVTLDTGEVLSYDKLALCMGSRVRKIPLAGSDLAGVHYLRDITDVEAIKKSITSSKHAVIVGGGYIGLETAAVLTRLGLSVTVLEMAPRILERVTAPEVSGFYHRIHTEEGVDIRTGVAVTALDGAGQVCSVRCADGTSFKADLVVIGAGIVPNVELAEAAGLEVVNGIVVDECCRTLDADIVAAGDCTSHPNLLYQKPMRLESVPNATEQGKTAAATLCGKAKPYHALPWFWSDQYDLKLQIAGLSQGYDQVIVRGDIETGRSFAAFYLKQSKLIAADCVNRPQEFMVSKRMIAAGGLVDSTKLADESLPPKELMAI